MIPTGHLLVGGAVGVSLAPFVPAELAPPLALVAGVVSHHLLDWLPHTDAGTFYNEEECKALPWSARLLVAGEGILGLGLTLGLFFSHHGTWAFLAGAFGGMLPDLLDNIPLWQRSFRQTRLGAAWHRFHQRWHCGDMTQLWKTGVVIDLAVVCSGLGFLLTI